MSLDVPLYALLVGIDAYPHPSIPPLRGASNDVAALADALTGELGVPPAQVRTLTDAAATRADIEAAFDDHLIGAGRAWVADGSPGPSPAFLFHFSGHGSQALDPTGTEPDGFDETLVPYDGREDAVHDIKDHELAGWLRRLPGDNVTVVLDCCHSGSGTRRPPPPGARRDATYEGVRAAPPDLRPQPAVRPQALGPTPGLDLRDAGRHVLLAACRDHEQAFELRRAVRTIHGALSAFLVPALIASLRQGGTTYRELHQAVRFDVNRHRPRQSPVCEGDLDRELFSSRRAGPERRRCAHVLGRGDGQVWLDVGHVHGVTVGSRLEVAGPDGHHGGGPVVTVRTVEPVRVAGPSAPQDADAVAGAPARWVHHDLGGARVRVLDGADAAELVGARPELEALLRVVQGADEADLRIVREPGEGTIVVVDAAGRERVRGDGPDQLGPALAHLARLHHLRSIERDDLGPGLPAGPSLSVGRARRDPRSGELVVDDLPVTDGVVELGSGDRVVVDVHNDAEVPLYAGVLLFTTDGGVAVLHPAVAGAEDRLAPGHRVRIGTGEDALVAEVPTGLDATTELLRAVVTTHPTSYEVLALEPPPAVWSPAGAFPVPPGGPAAVAAPPWPPPPPGGIASRWATASLTLVTRVLPDGHLAGTAPT